MGKVGMCPGPLPLGLTFLLAGENICIRTLGIENNVKKYISVSVKSFAKWN